MSDAPERDQSAPPESSDELEVGLETAAGVAQHVTDFALQIQAAVEGRRTSEVTAGGALSAAATALRGADEALDLLGADAAIQRVVYVGAQAASTAAQVYEAGEALLETGEAIIREMAGQADQYRVEYELECSAEEDASWRVREVELEERLGAPYCLRLSLITNNVDALPANLLGQDITLRIRRGYEASRSVHGVVSRVDHGQRSDRHLVTSIALRDIALSGEEWSVSQIARRFTRAKTADVEVILESFAALGELIVLEAEDGSRRYRRAVRSAA